MATGLQLNVRCLDGEISILLIQSLFDVENNPSVCIGINDFLG